MSGEREIIPARRGRALRIGSGETLRLINTHGTQVVDTWAFNAGDMAECMSMEHSRVAIGGIFPKPGDTMVTNKRRGILTLVEDTSPGIHDTLIAACDRYRYELLGVPDHDSCTDNLHAALAELGVSAPETPSPWNMWMNIPVGADGAVSFEPTVSKPGDHVLLRAEMDCVVAFSCCPQDILPINGVDCTPRDAAYERV
jgi:uncharacterized protein YcgI (DUF1989 family)